MKLIHAIEGFYLTVTKVRIFDPAKMFKNKKIAIVGPADSAFETQNGDYIDSFDYVIRINKALHSWSEEKSSWIGKKTDILFHSFFENNETGGGALDFDLFQKFRLQYLINPRTDFASFRRTFNIFRKYRKSTKLFHLPDSFYKKMSKPFGKYRPTIGYTALYSVLNSHCDTIFITGFTFFQTPYADGYRDQLQDIKENWNHISTHDIHNIDLEFRLFRMHLKTTNSRNVLLDEELQKIVTLVSDE